MTGTELLLILDHSWRVGASEDSGRISSRRAEEQDDLCGRLCRQGFQQSGRAPRWTSE